MFVNLLHPSRRSFTNVYNRCLKQAPYTTKAASTAVTYFASDLTAQMLERAGRVGVGQDNEAKRSPDFVRSLKFASVGGLWVGPLLTKWFNVMEVLVPGRTVPAIAKKMFLDQTVQGPFMIATMYAWCALGNGKSLPEIYSKLEEVLFETWMNSLYVWTPVQLVQQAMVPLQYRVIVANAVSYFWDTYLSYMMMTDAGLPITEERDECKEGHTKQSQGEREGRDGFSSSSIERDNASTSRRNTSSISRRQTAILIRSELQGKSQSQTG